MEPFEKKNTLDPIESVVAGYLVVIIATPFLCCFSEMAGFIAASILAGNSDLLLLDFRIVLTASIVMGVSWGCLRWFTYPHHRPRAIVWFGASILAAIPGISAIQYSLGQPHYWLGNLGNEIILGLVGATAGGLVALSQWLVLRNRPRFVVGWILLSSIAWFLACFVGAFLLGVD